MNKQELKLLTWIMAIAVMLLLLLYSPLGSPGIYKKQVYFTEKKGVSYSNINVTKAHSQVNYVNPGVNCIKSKINAIKSIFNAPKNITTKHNDIIELNVRDNYSEQRGKSRSKTQPTNNYNNTNFKNATYNITSNSNRSISNGNGNNFSSSSNFSSSDNKDGSVSTSSMSSISFSSGITAQPLLVNTSSMNIDLGMINDTTYIENITPRQKADEPIPIGDGWFILLGMCAVYFFIKRRILNTKAENIS